MIYTRMQAFTFRVQECGMFVYGFPLLMFYYLNELDPKKDFIPQILLTIKLFIAVKYLRLLCNTPECIMDSGSGF